MKCTLLWLQSLNVLHFFYGFWKNIDNHFLPKIDCIIAIEAYKTDHAVLQLLAQTDRLPAKLLSVVYTMVDSLSTLVSFSLLQDMLSGIGYFASVK
ncbi:hypothetical protein GJ496_008415 [Pomphorhynchus laevis]|nr:hypothetical protein GJ496_000514 [Pomphorhynchus laevis]KAI0987601.1 hypothetical protein GJ496_008415 [Pomphorhynchus laevis]